MERGPLAAFGAIVAVGLGPALWLGAQLGAVTLAPNQRPDTVGEQLKGSDMDFGGTGAGDPAEATDPVTAYTFPPVTAETLRPVAETTSIIVSAGPTSSPPPAKVSEPSATAPSSSAPSSCPPTESTTVPTGPTTEPDGDPTGDPSTGDPSTGTEEPEGPSAEPLPPLPPATDGPGF